MNAPPPNKSKSNREIALRGGIGSRKSRNRPASTRLWPAIVALNGFGLAANHASALELGDINVHSTLGQPLRASIAYALAQNEMIDSHCIFLRTPAAGNGMPVVRNATARTSNGVIRLTGDVPIREPILSLRLAVDCPGAANLSRDYTLLVDPTEAVPLPTAVDDSAPATVRRPETSAVPVVRRPARPAAVEASPISSRSTYRVQPGDTLSEIAARIERRSIGLWDAVEVIFAANPGAFIDNDRNLLKVGSVLILPDMGSVAAAPAAPAPGPRSTSELRDAAPSVAAAAPATAPVAAATNREPASATAATSEPTTVASPPVSNDPTPTDSPFVSPVESQTGNRASESDGTFGPAREVIPDTRVDAAGGRQLTPRVSVAPADSGDGLSSLAWLGGTGIAIILGLLLFGRQLKDRFGTPADLLPAGLTRGRRRTDMVDEPEPATTLDNGDPRDSYESPMRAQPVALDADLGTGSGFDDDGEIQVAQDFGFSTSRDLYGDPELPEAASRETDQGPTDMIPPTRFEDRRFADTVIVEKEIPPSDDTGEYDLSMIVDATRQRIGDSESTTKDLRAVQVDTGDHEVPDSEDITLSREVDYKILEQDYEEELTATQALNAKLLKELELPQNTGEIDATELFESSEAPTAEYAAIDEDLTRELPGNDDRTVEMPLDQDAVAEAPDTLENSGVNAEVTTELPAADNDETVDIDIESATIDTKRLRAS